MRPIVFQFNARFVDETVRGAGGGKVEHFLVVSGGSLDQILLLFRIPGIYLYVDTLSLRC